MSRITVGRCHLGWEPLLQIQFRRRTHRLALCALGLFVALAAGCDEVQGGLNGVRAHLAIQGKVDSSGQYVLDFGTVVTGTTSRLSLTVYDTGKAALTLQVPSVTAPFAVDLAAPATITGASHLDLPFLFSPTADGDIQQTVELQSDAGNARVLLKGKGIPPKNCTFVITPSLLDFGTIVVGQSKTIAAQLANLGDEDCSLADIRIDPASDVAFTLASGQAMMGSAPAIGGSFPLAVTFAPTQAATSIQGKLKLAAGPQSTPVELPLVGGAVISPCGMMLDPGEFRFTEVPGGQTATQIVNVVATGTEPCTISGLTMDAASDPSFKFATGQPTNGVATQGTPFPISVSFSPAANANDLYGRILFHVGPPDSIVFVPLIGNVTPCRFHVTPASASFGSVVPGIPVTKAINVVSDGPQVCHISNVRLDAATNPEFGLVAGQPTTGTSTVGSSFTISVTFAPLMPGLTATGSLLFDVAEPVSSVSVALEALPVCPNPASDGSCPATLLVTPTSMDFGIVTAGCHSRNQDLAMLVTGNNPVVIQSLDLIPAGGVFSAIPPSLPFVIGPGARVPLPMRFFPPAAMPYTGQLTIVSNATNVPVGAPGFVVTLAGMGTALSHQTDTFHEGGTPRTDVLLVIDDSGSMAEEQALLADNARTFITIADQLNADYQIAVTTTDVFNPFESGNFQGAPKIVRPGPNAASQLASTVRALGTNGSGNEEGLDGMWLALTDPLISDPTHNGGFLRQDARLAVVVVSDEDDQSTRVVDFYESFLKSIKGPGTASLVTFSAVVGPDGAHGGPGCTSANGDAVEGSRYIDLQARMGGVFKSICASDWGSIATDLGLNVFNPRVTFTLSRPADPATLVVHEEGAVVNPSRYTFDAVTNTVTFLHGSEPAQGHSLDFDYEAICL